MLPDHLRNLSVEEIIRFNLPLTGADLPEIFALAKDNYELNQICDRGKRLTPPPNVSGSKHLSYQGK